MESVGLRASLLVLVACTASAQTADLKAIPVAAPAYTPEQGLLFAGGGVLSWNGDPAHPELPRSSLTLIGGASTSGSVLVQSRLTAFTNADRVRFVMPIDVRDQPDQYFGVGFTAGFTRPQSAQRTFLRRTWWDAEPTVLVKLRGALYLGAVLQLSGTLARDVSPGVAADPDFQHGGARVVNTGVGVTLQYDSRDVPINAWQGTFLSATFTGYGRALGANTEWYAVALDWRSYLTLVRPGSTLAWQVKYRTAFGDVPWSELSLVGTPWDLRSYRWGQYRDRTALTAVVEYRFMLPFPAESLWSHLGFATWVGVGALGHDLWPNPTQLLPSAGAGLRVEWQKRITVRLDVGFGREARGVYFNFLEAF
jgi:outer membrane protein assembly factor BamA